MSAGTAASDHCPRCGGGLHCGVQDATPCPCTSVKLSADLRASLGQRYVGCLCLGCLQALSAETGVAGVAGAQTLRTTTLPTE